MAIAVVTSPPQDSWPACFIAAIERHVESGLCAVGDCFAIRLEYSLNAAEENDQMVVDKDKGRVFDSNLLPNCN